MMASRLTTLTGVGGVGKSRLALRVTRGVQRAFRDGVCLVESAKLQSPTATTVAVELGLREQPVRGPEAVFGRPLGAGARTAGDPWRFRG